MQIDEKTTLPLGLIIAIFGTLLVGVAGGAAWATRVDGQLISLSKDMAFVKTKLGIDSADNRPTPWRAPDNEKHDGTGPSTDHDGDYDGDDATDEGAEGDEDETYMVKK